MKILKGVYKMIVYLGFVFFLFIISFIITSFIYYNHSLDTLNKQNEVEVYLQDEVVSFSSYETKQINIEVKFKEKKTNEFLMMYAYYFFDIYNKPIQLFDYTDNLIITINKEEELTLLILK